MPVPLVECDRSGRRPPVKLKLSLPLRQASWLVERARAAGLSYGAYLASVIDGAPPRSAGRSGQSAEGVDRSSPLCPRTSMTLRAAAATAETAEAERYRERSSGTSMRCGST